MLHKSSRMTTILLFLFVGWNFGVKVVWGTDNSYYHSGVAGAHPNPSSSSNIRFISKAEVIKVERGEDAKFPCEVWNKGDNIMTFKYVPTASSKGSVERLFFAGDTEVLKMNRLRKTGEHFTLSRVRKTDAGYYICRIESEVPLELKHTLDVLYPPTISPHLSDTYHVVKGESLTLPCLADGNPQPIISWSRKGSLMPNGAMSIEKKSLVLSDIDRHQEGTYICHATNGIKSPASEETAVIVEYIPEIIVHKPVVHAGPGDQVQVMCEVFGRPKPTVSWLRGSDLMDSNNYKLEDDGRTLLISEVTDQDFGNYSCSARNKHGRVEAIVVLTGVPTKPTVTSSDQSEYKNSYVFSWTTDSPAEILQYRIRYRNSQTPNNSWYDTLHFPNSQIKEDSKPTFVYHHYQQSGSNSNYDPYGRYSQTPYIYSSNSYNSKTQTQGARSRGNVGGNREFQKSNIPVTYSYTPLMETIGRPNDNVQNHNQQRILPPPVSPNILPRQPSGTYLSSDAFKSSKTILSPPISTQLQRQPITMFYRQDQHEVPHTTAYSEHTFLSHSIQQYSQVNPRVPVVEEKEELNSQNLEVHNNNPHDPNLSRKVREENPSSTAAGEDDDGDRSSRVRRLSHIIYHLSPDNTYEVSVAVENKYGWSEHSDLFTFYTRAETTTTSTTTTTDEYHPRPQAEEVATGGLANSASSKSLTGLRLRQPLHLLGTMIGITKGIHSTPTSISLIVASWLFML